MLDPINIKYLAEMREKEIQDRINDVHPPEPVDLRAAFARLWHRMHSPEQPAEEWQPPRTIKHAP